MIRHLRRALILATLCAGAALLVLSATVVAQPSYSGSLSSSSSPAGILGTGAWITPGVTNLSWTVSQELSGLWDYNYTFTVPTNISHLLLETSSTFGASNLMNPTGNFTSTKIGTFSPSDPGNANPNLPGTLYGIKFDGFTTTTGTISFQSDRDPIWGNFYSKNGQAGGIDNTAWNAGFLNPRPTDPPANGTVDNHVLVPDTGQPVPDASTIVLACFGTLQLLVVRRRILRRD